MTMLHARYLLGTLYISILLMRKGLLSETEAHRGKVIDMCKVSRWQTQEKNAEGLDTVHLHKKPCATSPTCPLTTPIPGNTAGLIIWYVSLPVFQTA
jgi:hypothetical protein